MFSVPLKCGNCNNLVDFIFNSAIDHTERTPEQINAIGATSAKHSRMTGSRFIELGDQDKVQGSTHSHCPRCNFPALIVYNCSRQAHESIKDVIKDGRGNLMGGSSMVTVESYFPRPKKADQDAAWPDSLRQQFSDAQDILSENKSPSIVLATCRTVLELALKELSQDDTSLTLYKRIERLHSEGVITSPIKDWAHDIRLGGNEATHDGIGEKAEAEEYIEFLRQFLNVAFSLPVRIEEKRQRRNDQ